MIHIGSRKINMKVTKMSSKYIAYRPPARVLSQFIHVNYIDKYSYKFAYRREACFLCYYCPLLRYFMPGFYLLDHGNSHAEMIFISRATGVDYFSFLKGELSLPAPVYFKQHLGAVLYDHVVGGDPALHIYHRRFFDALHHAGITGFVAVPAILQSHTTTKEYACLVVTGRAGEEDLRTGKIIDLGPIAPGAPSKIVKRGVFFDEATWDGADMFLLKDKRHVIVTEKVKDIVVELGLSNVRVVPLEEVEVSIFNLTGRDKALREYYMEKLEKGGE